ncbi:sigma-70 region 4 domain-containing protein [Novosphingobium sp.]|uniref:sigma-70 region 4 domain-containing protein n=1 Tax=Novosphingobium sp. TaxID=1874826 RepID=UPI0031D3A902
MSGAGTGEEPGSFHSGDGDPQDHVTPVASEGADGAPDAAAPSIEAMDAIFAAMPKLARDIFIARQFHDLSVAEICKQTGLSRKQVRRQFAKAFEHLHHSHSGMELWREHIAAMPTDYLEQVRSSLSMSVRSKRAYERARASFRFNKRRHAGPPPDPETVARVQSALARLSGLERDVFLAVSVDDMSYAQIGEKIGRSEQMVMKLFGRALYNLDCNLRDPRRHWWRRWITYP